ncbi:FAD/NAD(P)-binding protein [Streptomyces fuscigenes]|uniref:FAD/NAD(P)-binding protein n=1 Tax=Streptomyces fuscigenes TaxID=1528880 RepID=UPI001F3CC96F|nr:FAD/NAD(P)-binding protein [Streptomyces fuscigenes]MCF3963795.1 FAD/NAD(P)-binding protein [Streptomyces fuscigenes]
MNSRHLDICVVGAGPRGVSVLERLCAKERKSPSGDRLTVHVVDPSPPGPGAVWRTTQSRHLLMNTVASQVTLFTDASVRMDGPVEEGPSLHTWAKDLLRDGGGTADDSTLAEARDLGPDDYPTRAFYGQYLTWVFHRLTATAPAHMTIRVHRARAVELDDERGEQAGPQVVVLDDGTRLTGLDAVVLALGHLPALPTSAEAALASFAADHGLRYLPPGNPADADAAGIAPGEPVALRGLGLNFFDWMAQFTTGRGGSFEPAGGDRLVYRPSGREPKIYAGSRRGVPYHARGDNEKGAHGRHEPRLLTAARIARMRSAMAGSIGFTTHLWPLIAREVESVYYAALLRSRGTEAESFTARYLGAGTDEERAAVLAAAGLSPADRWDWGSIQQPYGDKEFAGPVDFRRWLLGHLADDVRAARHGNVSGPLKAALDVLRDLRNEVRLAVDHGGLDGGSYRDELGAWYTPLNAFLSIGPPASRVAELIALIEAGVVEIAGPGARVSVLPDDGEGAAFLLESPAVPGSARRATTLIEARLPEPDVRRTADPLLRHLLGTGQCAPYRMPGAGGVHESGGLAVTRRPYRLLDADGWAHPRRFAYGVPTEAVHWVTAAGIRPGVGSVTLEDSDAIAGAVLSLARVVPRRVPGPSEDTALEEAEVIA